MNRQKPESKIAQALGMIGGVMFGAGFVFTIIDIITKEPEEFFNNIMSILFLIATVVGLLLTILSVLIENRAKQKSSN